MYTDMAGAIKKCDEVISKLTSSGISVTILPGKNDSSDSFHPQRPLAKLFFRKAMERNPELLHLASNPASFKINDVHLYGSSGENLEDFRRFTKGMDDPIDQMRFL